ANIDDLGEVVSTDVLIVGGGFGGIIAAIKAKEHPVDVLVVEKATVGWAGKAPHIGGSLTFLGPDDDPDKFVEYQVKSMGGYLNDQDLLYRYAHKSYGAVQQLMTWGCRLAKDAEGKLETRKHRVGPWSQTDIDLDCQLPLRAKARKLGVKLLNKIQVVELLTQKDRVVGAVGFSILDGKFYIFKAKATILANGSCDYKVERMWSSACGDGIAAAYRAGAEMRNAEFGNFYEKRRKDTDAPARGGGQEYLVNALGEHISRRYVPDPQPDISMDAILGIEREILEGRGPVYMDVSKMTKLIRNIPKVSAIKQRQAAKAAKYGFPPSLKPEVLPAFLGELSCIKVDHDMKTSLSGLWAIGDTSYAGSAQPGAVPAPPGRTGGSGIMNAALGAFEAGPNAARFASQSDLPTVSDNQVKRLKDDIFAPARRSNGLEPFDAIYAIQDVVSPVKYNLRRSKERLEEALSKIEEVQDNLSDLVAKDAHYLGKCHETNCFAVCAEMTFRAALMRTESRGWHYREDYPQQDNKKWLKWIILKQESGKMALSTQPVPIDKYKFKP
ncbi:FAD-binding protein, partial [Thermodesulfobacteriota bacterium]